MSGVWTSQPNRVDFELSAPPVRLVKEYRKTNVPPWPALKFVCQ
jgi:hypothetical protein